LKGISATKAGWLTALVMLPAAAALVLGAVIFVKRKFL